MTLTQFNSNNSLTPEFRSKKEITWKNSLTYRPRLKKDLWSKFGLGPKIRTSRQAQSGIRAKIHSWSTIHYVSKICESARFTAKIHNPCAFEGQIRRSENLFTPLIKRRWLRWCFETKIKVPNAIIDWKALFRHLKLCAWGRVALNSDPLTKGVYLVTIRALLWNSQINEFTFRNTDEVMEIWTYIHGTMYAFGSTLLSCVVAVLCDGD